MKYAIFLDVDGVLNTRRTVQRTPEGYHGIDDARVEILSNVMKKYKDADLVLTSDWKELRAENEDYRYLLAKLEKYGLKLAGSTEDHYIGNCETHS